MAPLSVKGDGATSFRQITSPKSSPLATPSDPFFRAPNQNCGRIGPVSHPLLAYQTEPRLFVELPKITAPHRLRLGETRRSDWLGVGPLFAEHPQRLWP